MNNKESFEVYKGLQKPLVFKTFKGRYIYWMAGGLLGSFILCVILCVLIGYLVGGIALVGGACAITYIVNTKQKTGVHSKTRTKGIVYVKPVVNHLASKKSN
tara:strand:- start:19909 stop:20214 length:306 start_codon:yes stop_codon:yes gene_type:complete